VAADTTPTAYEIAFWRLWRAALQRRFDLAAVETAPTCEVALRRLLVCGTWALFL